MLFKLARKENVSDKKKSKGTVETMRNLGMKSNITYFLQSKERIVEHVYYVVIKL